MRIARLQIPTGWLVEWNTLTEPDGTADHPPYNDLDEDLLLLKNDHRQVIIDLGWYPEQNPKGQFTLSAVRLEEDVEAQVEAWDSPLRIRKSRSFSEILTVLEDWLADGSLRQPPKELNEESRNIRLRIVKHMELLASANSQKKYERKQDCPHVPVPVQLINEFTNELFRPKWEPFLNAFTENELKLLAELYGRLSIAASAAFDRDSFSSVAKIQKIPEWRAVMAFAKGVAVELKRNARNA